MVHQRKNLISIEIVLGAYQEFIEHFIHLALSRTSSYTCVANVHMLIEAHKDEAFAMVVNNADLVTPDGMPLAKGLDLLYGGKQQRVAGMDLLPDLLRQSEISELPVFIYGGTQEMLKRTRDYCGNVYPKLKIAGMYSPPFRPLMATEEDAIANMINNSGARFVFVALGCPKQEKWMASMKGRIHACMIGIGGALPVLVGMQKRAPLWLQKASLEWLYRLGQEPQRLFKRYAVTNSTFLYLFLKTYAAQGFKQKNLF